MRSYYYFVVELPQYVRGMGAYGCLTDVLLFVCGFITSKCISCCAKLNEMLNGVVTPFETYSIFVLLPVTVLEPFSSHISVFVFFVFAKCIRIHSVCSSISLMKVE